MDIYQQSKAYYDPRWSKQHSKEQLDRFTTALKLLKEAHSQLRMTIADEDQVLALNAIVFAHAKINEIRQRKGKASARELPAVETIDAEVEFLEVECQS